MEMNTLLFMTSWSLLGLLALIFWIWALVDIVKHKFRSSDAKLLWILVVVILPVLGTILYFFIGRNQRRNIE